MFSGSTGGSSTGGGGGDEDTDAASREFQKGLDSEQTRRARMDDRLSLRRKDRKEHIKKKRKKLTGRGVPVSGEDLSLKSGSAADGGGGAVIEGGEVPDWVKVENLSDIVEMVKSSDLQKVFRGVQAVRQLLSVEKAPPICEVLDTGVLPKLLDIMRMPLRFRDAKKRSDKEATRAKLQFEAAWAATNIASGDSEYAQELVRLGGVEAFTDLIKHSRDPAAIDQAIWGLGNIAGDCVQFRDLVLKTGVLSFILKNLQSFPAGVQRNAIWTVSNLCRGKPSPAWDKVSGIMQPLTTMLERTLDYEIVVDMLWSLSFLSEDRQERKDEPLPSPLLAIMESGRTLDEADYSFQLDALMKTGVVPKVIQLIQHASDMSAEAFKEISERRAKGLVIPDAIKHKLSTADFLMSPCTRILGNMVSGTDPQTQHVLDSGFFGVIHSMLQSRVRNVRKEACWALSNVVAGTTEQLNLFFTDSALIDAVVELCLKGDVNVRKEAGWCLSNSICGADFEQISALVRNRFFAAMIGLMTMMNIPKVLLMAMEAIDGSLSSYNRQHGKAEGEFGPWVQRCEELRILEALEEIQANEKIPDGVANAAATLVLKFWPPDEGYGPSEEAPADVMDDATISQTGDTFGFGAGGGEAPGWGPAPGGGEDADAGGDFGF